MNATKDAPAKSPSRRHTAALRCVRRGWPVFPAHSVKEGSCTCGREDCPIQTRGKHPRTMNGVKDASTDPAQIDRWWTRWPDANIGIATGEASGLVVLDVDPRNGGWKSLRKLLDGREMPQTPAVGTGGGGLHFYFASSKGLRVTSRSSILPGLDVKAGGGYVIAAGSLHWSGDKYVWKFGLTPEKVRVASVPQWLARALSNSTRRTRTRGETNDEPVVEGQRHDFLVRLAGTLRREGASPGDIDVALSVVNAARCAPPLPQREVAEIARSTEGWTPGTAGISEYDEDGAGIFWNRITRDGLVPTRLTNFSARIVADIAEDDGREVRRTYEIRAELFGRKQRFLVPAAQFPAMNWATENLGPRAIVSPGMGLRDHGRAAIQHLSTAIEDRVVFTHAGWRKSGDNWVYLHGDGAIGEAGLIRDISVRLPSSLSPLLLPPPPNGEARKLAVQASLRLLTLTEPRISFPLFDAIWSSVMGRIDYTIFLGGPTGVGKTELVALHQQHLGPGFTARNLPGSWASTGNANEALAFTAKDALLVLDDFAPTGTRGDVARYNREADRIIRAQGNAAGRLRMRADGTLRLANMPRGLILSTGEDVPRGQSLRARMFVLELGAGLDWDLLTKCQRDANGGLYAQAMSAYLQWLAPRYATRSQQLPSALAEWRAEAASSAQHKRTPEIVAHLQVGLCRFLQFARSVGAVSEEQARELKNASWRALGVAAAAQNSYQRAEDPVRRFLELIRSALSTGRAYLTDSKNGYSETRKGDAIGWKSDAMVFLDPDAAFATAQKLAQEQGEFLSVGQKTLWQRMRDRGLLARSDSERNSFRVTIGGRRRPVIALSPRTLGLAV
jgi:hypothetical protein